MLAEWHNPEPGVSPAAAVAADAADDASEIVGRDFTYPRAQAVEQDALFAMTDSTINPTANLNSTVFSTATVASSISSSLQSLASLANANNTGSDSREILNVEFWGQAGIEGPHKDVTSNRTNTYKALRIAGKSYAYLYTVWCTGESELYDTLNDPWELTNLAKGSRAKAHERLIHRLDALLLVTKSCAQGSCRDPWMHLQPPHTSSKIQNLPQAMNASFDTFFHSGLPCVQFNKCMDYQFVPNEGPYHPPKSKELGRNHREETDDFQSSHVPKCTERLKENRPLAGGPEQRNVTLGEIMKTAKVLTKKQLGEC
jgi:N-acetylglucosamine-6-sulfatase